MMSDRKFRTVERQTAPFSAVAVVKAELQGSPWAQALAESILHEQINDQIGPLPVGLDELRKLRVYTVDYERATNHYLHNIHAPDGITVQAVEEVPRWWEAVDDMPIYRVPNGPGLMIALLPSQRMDEWRKSGWPDRPHP